MTVTAERIQRSFCSRHDGGCSSPVTAIVNLDCIVFAQRPKLSDYKTPMRRQIAAWLQVDPSDVSVKAKTGESVGPIGREEAIAAEAIVLLDAARTTRRTSARRRPRRRLAAAIAQAIEDDTDASFRLTPTGCPSHSTDGTNQMTSTATHKSNVAETPRTPDVNLRIYNTLTRKKEPLQTVVPGKCGIYLCGPTVYREAHIGHMVGPVIFDTIKRYLTYCGYDVTWVVNITDVDDKLIAESQRTASCRCRRSPPR